MAFQKTKVETPQAPDFRLLRSEEIDLVAGGRQLPPHDGSKLQKHPAWGETSLPTFNINIVVAIQNNFAMNIAGFGTASQLIAQSNAISIG